MIPIPTPQPDAFELSGAVSDAFSMVNAVDDVVIWIVGVGIGLFLLGMVVQALRDALSEMKP